MIRSILLTCAFAMAAGTAISSTSGKEIVKKMPDFPELVKEGRAYVIKAGERKTPTASDIAEKGLTISLPTSKQSVGQRTYRSMAKESSDYEWKLDSVVATNPDGTPTVRQTFTYDDRGNSLQQKYYAWNPMSEEWVIQILQESEWNEANAQLSSKEVYYSEYGDSGTKYTYFYGDDQINPAGADIYYLDPQTGDWIQSQRSLWQYDSNSYMTEEIVMLPDANGVLVNSSKATATYDAMGNPTNRTWYAWNGVEWEPVNSRVNIEYNSEGRMIFWLQDIWTGTEWQYVKRMIQKWEGSKLVYGTLEYYNPETDDWNSDGTIYMSSYVTIQYDEKDRPILEVAYFWDPDQNDYVLTSSVIDEYEPLENGGYRNYNTMTLYDEIIQYTVNEYNKAGNLTFKHEDAKLTDKLAPRAEYVLVYDESGKYLIEESDYSYDGDTRLAFVRQQTVWSKDGYQKESYHWNGKLMYTGEGDPDDWERFTKFIYDYDGGMELGRMCYMWNGEEYAPSWGNSTIVDFSVPAAEWCHWINTDVETKFMIAAKRNYSPDGMDWKYQEGLYYNSRMGESEVKTVSSENSVKVSPNPATDYITVTGAQADRYDIYSMQGALVATSGNSEICVSTLPRGIYLLRAGKETTRFIKK